MPSYCACYQLNIFWYQLIINDHSLAATCYHLYISVMSPWHYSANAWCHHLSYTCCWCCCCLLRLLNTHYRFSLLLHPVYCGLWITTCCRLLPSFIDCYQLSWHPFHNNHSHLLLPHASNFCCCCHGTCSTLEPHPFCRYLLVLKAKKYMIR